MLIPVCLELILTLSKGDLTRLINLLIKVNCFCVNFMKTPCKLIKFGINKALPY